MKAFRATPEKVFAEAVEDNRKLTTAIEVDTPDPYLDTALSAALLVYDAAWNAPTFRHGAIAWHDSFAGWHVTYAGITTRLGKNPAVFVERAKAIAAAMKARLWSERAGVYGEYPLPRSP